MATILTPSGGMTVRDTKRGDIVLTTRSPSARRRGGGGGGGSAPAPAVPQVRIDGNSVFIDGQGFTVRPEDQASFIQQRTGGSGTSAQSAIQQAQQRAIQIQQAQAQAQAQAKAQAQAQAQAQEKLKKILNLSKKRAGEISKTATAQQIKKYADIASGGLFTKRELMQRQKQLSAQADFYNALFSPSKVTPINQNQFEKDTAKIILNNERLDKLISGYNEEVKKFNEKYGDKELSQEEYNKVQRKKDNLDKEGAILDKLSSSSNKEINEYKKKYGVKELTPELEKTRERISESLSQKEQGIEADVIKFRKSLANKIGKVLNTEQELLSPREIEAYQKKELPKAENKLKDIQNKLKNAQGLNKKRLVVLEKSAKDEIARIKRGETPRFIKGNLPITPISLPGIGLTRIQIIGTSKRISPKKFKVNLKFTNKSGTSVGKATATIVKKGNKFSISQITGATGLNRPSQRLLNLGELGIKSQKQILKMSPKTAKNYFKNLEKVLSKKEINNLKKIRSFAGRSSAFTTRRIIKTPRIKTAKIDLSKRRVDIITKKKKLKNFFDSFMKGRVISAQGLGLRSKPVLKIGGLKKVKKKVDLDDFISIASQISPKKLNYIIGKTITKKGNKAEFIGFIRNIKNPKNISNISSGALTLKQKSQYKKALKQVMAVISTAVIKSRRTPALKSVGVVNSSARLINATKLKGKSLPQMVKSVATKKITPVSFPVSTIKLKQELSKKTGTRTSQRTIQVQSPRTRTAQRTRQAQKLRLKQSSKLRTTKIKKPVTPNIPTRFRGFKIPKFEFPKRKIIKKSSIKRRKLMSKFDVYARPVGSKKFRKINYKGLTKSKAQDLGAYAVDNSLSRTFKVVPKGSKVKNSIRKPVNKPLKVAAGYYNKIKKKLRPYRIIKGRRKPILSRIEKNKYLLDTSREKRKITLEKLLSAKRQPKKKVISSAQRKILLKRLKKARKVLARKKR